MNRQWKIYIPTPAVLISTEDAFQITLFILDYVQVRYIGSQPGEYKFITLCFSGNKSLSQHHLLPFAKAKSIDGFDL